MLARNSLGNSEEVPKIQNLKIVCKKLMLLNLLDWLALHLKVESEID